MSTLLLCVLRRCLQCSTRWSLFLIFVGCTATGSLLLWLLVPETRGLPIEEIHLAWASHWFWGQCQAVKQRTQSGLLGQTHCNCCAINGSDGAAAAVAAEVCSEKGSAAVVADGCQPNHGCKVHEDVAVATHDGAFRGKLPP